jgi:CDP-paratose 2-epimerase
MSESIHKKNTQSASLPVIGLVEWFRPGEHARVEQVLADARTLGVKEIRTGISWADYYTPQGKEWYNWLIPRLAKEVNLLPCFLYTPPALGIVHLVAPVQPQSLR